MRTGLASVTLYLAGAHFEYWLEKKYQSNFSYVRFHVLTAMAMGLALFRDLLLLRRK
jgi:hypothetical protein